MIKKFKAASWLTGLSILIGLFAITQFGPGEQIATHWDSNGEADGYMSPIPAFFFMPAIQIVMLLVFSNLHFIEPRGENLQKSWKAVVAIITAVFALLTAIQFVIYGTAKEFFSMSPNLVFGMVGVMFMVIGNYFGKLHSTFLIGLRTPWTLSSDAVWRKTHRLGGKLFVGAGLIMLVTSSLIPGNLATSVAVGVIAIAALTPLGYSWVLWLKEKNTISN